MLETGRNCISCGKKKFLCEFNMSDICNDCTKEQREDDNLDQFKMSCQFSKGVGDVDICKCDRYFVTRNGHYKGCDLCRNEFGMLEHIEQKKVLKSEKHEIGKGKKDQKSELEQIKEKEISTIQTQSLKRINSKEIKSTEEKISKNLMTKNENTEERTRKSIMPDKELVTTEIEKTDSELLNSEDSGETRHMVTVNLSNNLRTENSNSINLLTESATLLNTSAKTLLVGNKGDFGDEVIRKPTVNESEMALKLALGANELMKTKLDYIRTGKVLINDMYDLLEDQE